MSEVRLTFLGTGTSQGIPIIGCGCEVCKSQDPRDKRLRSSVLVDYDGIRIVVDPGPDFRYQMLRAGVGSIDAILITHNHKDHTGGLDDTRAFNLNDKRVTSIYCEKYVEESLRKEYSYSFAEPRYPGAPDWSVHNIDGSKPFKIYEGAIEDELTWESGVGYHHKPSSCTNPRSVTVVPIQGWHHKVKKLSVLGYRFGDIAYLTDMNLIDDEEIAKLKGVKAVTINCVKRGGHHSHFSLQEALDFFAKVGAEDSYITHLSHMLPRHELLEAELPEHVHVAYDGLVLESRGL